MSAANFMGPTPAQTFVRANAANPDALASRRRALFYAAMAEEAFGTDRAHHRAALEQFDAALREAKITLPDDADKGGAL